jgi:pimeloyl-ACP methyl ester carboxylesterase
MQLSLTAIYLLLEDLVKILMTSTSSTLKGYMISGFGAPVVLLHSSMSSKKQWCKLTRKLESKHQVIAIDLLGYGDTIFCIEKNSYSLGSETESVRLILEQHLSLADPVHLAGHSFGAATCLRFAYNYPEKVKAFTLFEPVPFHLLAKTQPLIWKLCN